MQYQYVGVSGPGAADGIRVLPHLESQPSRKRVCVCVCACVLVRVHAHMCADIVSCSSGDWLLLYNNKLQMQDWFFPYLHSLSLRGSAVSVTL